ncbi:MAG: hypothetical protein AVDCRST_MAG07-3422, partial [uncultured Frankineae bacterium]
CSSLTAKGPWPRPPTSARRPCTTRPRPTRCAWLRRTREDQALPRGP